MRWRRPWPRALFTHSGRAQYEIRRDIVSPRNVHVLQMDMNVSFSIDTDPHRVTCVCKQPCRECTRRAAHPPGGTRHMCVPAYANAYRHARGRTVSPSYRYSVRLEKSETQSMSTCATHVADAVRPYPRRARRTMSATAFHTIMGAHTLHFPAFSANTLAKQQQQQQQTHK